MTKELTRDRPARSEPQDAEATATRKDPEFMML